MRIHFDKQKLVISPWISVVAISIALILAVYMLWPEAPKSEGVKLSAEAKAALTRRHVTPSTMMSVPAPEGVSSEVSIRTSKSVAVVAQAQSASAYIQPPPPFGADAVGAPGAWDGERQDGSNSAPESLFSEYNKDYLGNPCHRVPSQMPVATLRALVPPTSENLDECGYRSALLYSGNVEPSEIQSFGGFSYQITSEYVAKLLRIGNWTIADFEELVRRGQAFGAMGGLNIYLILKEANSPMAAMMLDLSPGLFDQYFLERYIETEQCPDGITGKYCIAQ